MSGQEVLISLAKLSSLSLGSKREEIVTVGVFDMSGFPPVLASVEGFVSLKFFEKTPFTTDYKSRTLVIENEASMLLRLAKGKHVPISVHKDGTIVGIFLELSLPNRKSATVEVDTGSDALILNSKFMEELKVDKEGDKVEKVEGRDETGHDFARYFAELNGTVGLVADPSFAQRNPKVMFQDVIYDGLVGQSFLRQYTETYDIPHSTMIFAES